MSRAESPSIHPSTGGPGPLAPVSAPAPRAVPAIAPRRVLIACSEPATAEVLERLVRHHGPDLWPAGVDVRTAADGVRCLQLAELWRPDVLLVQPRLDRMAGAEVLDAWRRAHPGERLPAVALSSVFGADVPSRESFDGVLPVPWEGPELVETLARALSSRS